MSRVKLQKNHYSVLTTLLEDGQMKVKLILRDLVKKENDFTTFLQCLPVVTLALKLMIKKELFVTVESLPKIRKKIYPNKLSLCDRPTQVQLLFQILVLGLIGSVKVFSPLYDKLKITKWNKLLSIMKIDYVGMLTNSSSTFSSYSKLKSWFSIQEKKSRMTQNWLEIYCPLSTLPPVKKWIKEDVEIQNQVIYKSRKYELKPTKKQIKVLNSFINDCRFTYNKGVELFNNFEISNFHKLCSVLVIKDSGKNTNELIPDWIYNIDNKFRNRHTLNDYINDYNNSLLIPDWLYKDKNELKNIFIPESIYNTPKSIRASELKVLSTNIKSAFSNLKNKNIKYFKMKYRSKKSYKSQILNEESRCSSIYEKNEIKYLDISKLKGIKIKSKKNIKINHDIKIEKTKENKWFLILSNEVEVTKSTKERICALDPGYRTFQTGIDLKGNIFEIGKDVYKRIYKIYKESDKFQSLLKLSKKNGKTYKEYKSYVRNKYNFYKSKLKVKNLIKELHNQTCKYLTDHYDKIILPIFGTSKMKTKNNTSYFNRMIDSLKCFQFKTKLENKCKSLNKKLIIVDENYTSLTCSNCECINYLLGSSKTFICNNLDCKKVFDRDQNSAYNILKNVLIGSLKIY